MARGYWRNWAELRCRGGFRIYKKDALKLKGVCPECGEYLEEVK